jgi:hypothetical protein
MKVWSGRNPIPVQFLIRILIVEDEYGILASRQVVNFQYGFRRLRRHGLRRERR